MYYAKGGDKNVHCELCPHYCKIADGNQGRCRVRENKDGTLYALNYGKLTSYAYDPIEKKPLYHFYPGSNIFSIGSFGCNLACDFCQNWQIVYDDSLARDISKDHVISLAKDRKSIGIAYTYNEPGIWFEYILDLSKEIKDSGLKNVMITNGYINEEPLKDLLPYMDAMNIDLKSIDDSFYRRLCKASLDPVLRTIDMASRSVHIELTTLVIGGENSSAEGIEKLAKKIGEIDKSIPLHLSRYFPAHRMKLPPTSIETLIEAREIAKGYLDYVYIGNVPNMDNNTYCPRCGSKLINRGWIANITGIEDGKCRECSITSSIIN